MVSKPKIRRAASIVNTAARRPKRQITIRLDVTTIEYFKKMSRTTAIPYQNLINLYLRDCAATKMRLRLNWTA
jgi:uncharacterized protein (DUF4415 family)